MYNPDTELLFPSRVIPILGDQRRKTWQKLVGRVSSQEPDTLDHLAFVLMMVRLGGCSSCHSDSYRAMRGCTQCALQTVRRFRGTDSELVKLFNEYREEIESYIQSKSKT